eukprot:scaffold330450_cov61-Tisochrysis_lutea.AAC.1
MWTNARTGRRLQWIKHPEIPPSKSASEKGPHASGATIDNLFIFPKGEGEGDAPKALYRSTYYIY